MNRGETYEDWACENRLAPGTNFQETLNNVNAAAVVEQIKNLSNQDINSMSEQQLREMLSKQVETLQQKPERIINYPNGCHNDVQGEEKHKPEDNSAATEDEYATETPEYTSMFQSESESAEAPDLSTVRIAQERANAINAIDSLMSDILDNQQLYFTDSRTVSNLNVDDVLVMSALLQKYSGLTNNLLKFARSYAKKFVSEDSDAIVLTASCLVRAGLCTSTLGTVVISRTGMRLRSFQRDIILGALPTFATFALNNNINPGKLSQYTNIKYGSIRAALFFLSAITNVEPPSSLDSSFVNEMLQILYGENVTYEQLCSGMNPQLHTTYVRKQTVGTGVWNGGQAMRNTQSRNSQSHGSVHGTQHEYNPQVMPSAYNQFSNVSQITQPYTNARMVTPADVQASFSYGQAVSTDPRVVMAGCILNFAYRNGIRQGGVTVLNVQGIVFEINHNVLCITMENTTYTAKVQFDMTNGTVLSLTEVPTSRMHEVYNLCMAYEHTMLSGLPQ